MNSTLPDITPITFVSNDILVYYYYSLDYTNFNITVLGIRKISNNSFEIDLPNIYSILIMNDTKDNKIARNTIFYL